MSPASETGSVRESITFRVFVSSTFQDFVTERNGLQERVWPRLQSLCQQHGARFQAIDLRWGISEQASREQQIMQICLEEIRRCQQVTPRPNFIVLLGDRYGWRPSPEIIAHDEFDAIRSHLSDEERALVERWYALDENAVPAEYCLLSRADVGYEEWVEIEADLHQALLAGAEAAGLPEEAIVKFERSATEQEIIAGALEADPRNAFAYIREIEGLPEDRSAKDFIDRKYGARDLEAEELLNDLKRRLANHLPEGHHHEIETRWDGEGLSGEHIERLCDLIREDLERVILEEIGKLEAVDPLEHEIAQHRTFAEDRARHFVGRYVLRARIGAYLTEGGGHPLVIHGRSGSGKSALMARVLSELPDDAAVIARFTGATPASTHLHFLLRGLCEQIHREFGFAALEEQWREEQRSVPRSEGSEPPQNPYAVPGDPKELARALRRFLEFVPHDRPLVILLDALDQLSPEENAHSLNWLPMELPANVRIVASVLEREDAAGQCHRSAQRRLPEEALLELRELSVDEGEQILDSWLTESGRTLQPEQRGDLLRSYEAAPEGHALFMRLAFEEARRWRSFDGLPTGADDVPGLSETIEGVITDMLARLEAPANHGRVLTQWALSYLAAARNGLAEDEMLAVLSADERVLADFRERSPFSPHTDHLPPIVWSRLYFDLQPYLTERAADGASLLAFYHRQVGEMVHARYSAEEDDRLRAHAHLGAYFGTQSDWTGGADHRAPHYRRMSELAHQLLRARGFDELAGVLCDYSFTEAKCSAGMVYDLLRDHYAAGGAMSEDAVGAERWTELRAWGSFVAAESQRLATGEEPFLQIAHNHADGGPVAEAASLRAASFREPWLRLRNRARYVARPACIQALRHDGAEVWGVEIAPDGRHMLSGDGQGRVRVWEIETGECVAVLEGHEKFTTGIEISPDGHLALSSSQDGTLRLWDLDVYMCARVLEGHGERGFIVNREWTRVISAGEGRDLWLWDLESGDHIATLEAQTTELENWVKWVGASADGRRCYSVSDYPDLRGKVRLWDVEAACPLGALEHECAIVTAILCSDGRLVFGTVDGDIGIWRSDDEQPLLRPADAMVTSLLLAGDDRVFAGGQDGRITLRDLTTLQVLADFVGHDDDVCDLALLPRGDRLLSISHDQSLRLWDIDSQLCEAAYRGHTGRPFSVDVTPDGALAISSGEHGEIRVWDLGVTGASPLPETHGRAVTAMAAGPHGGWLASGGRDRTVRLWESSTGRCLRVLPCADWVECVGVDPSGTRLAAGGGNDATREGFFCVWDLPQLNQLTPPERSRIPQVNDLAMTPDGKHVLSCGFEVLGLWSAETGRTLAYEPNTMADTVAVTPDSRYAIAGMTSGRVGIWDLESRQRIAEATGHEDWVWDLAVSPDGMLACSGSTDRTVRVWSIPELSCRHVLTGHEARVTTVAFDQEHAAILSGDSSGEIRVWDTDSGDCRHVVEAHTDWVQDLVPAPSGSAFLSVGDDGRLCVWRTEDWARMASHHFGATWVRCCTASPEGDWIAVGTGSGRVYILEPKNMGLTPQDADISRNAAREVELFEKRRDADGARLLTEGSDRWSEGRYDEAEDLLKEALAALRSTEPVDTVGVATALNLLGLINWKQARYPVAFGLFTEARSHFDELQDRRSIATILNNMAVVRDAEGSWDEAEELLLRAVQMHEETDGPRSPSVAMDQNNLANVYRNSGRYDEALALYEEALEIRRNAFGHEHERVAQTLFEVAELHRLRGDIAEAERIHRESAAIRRSVLPQPQPGWDHPDLARSYCAIGHTLLLQGKRAEAQPYLGRAWSFLGIAFRSGHPLIRACEELHDACVGQTD